MHIHPMGLLRIVNIHKETMGLVGKIVILQYVIASVYICDTRI